MARRNTSFAASLCRRRCKPKSREGNSWPTRISSGRLCWGCGCDRPHHPPATNCQWLVQTDLATGLTRRREKHGFPTSLLAAELVRLKVAVIVTSGGALTRRAKEATSTIPIVMTNDPDPVGDGFVASLAHPGGN